MQNTNIENANEPFGSGYTLLAPDANGGIVAAHEFTGDEMVGTRCPACGQCHTLPLHEFFALMGDDRHDLYGTQVYCGECSANHTKEGR